MDPRTDQKHLKDSSYSDPNKLNLRNEIQEEYGNHPVPWFEWVFNLLDLTESSRILELGCGTGTLWQENNARVPSGWEIAMSDSALSMVQVSRANLLPLRRGWSFTSLDGQVLPFRDESFDAVLAVGLLDQVSDLNQALGEAWRVLRPSGQLIATAGGKGHLQEFENMLRPFIPVDIAHKIGGNEEHFGLENGERLLSPFFEEVVRHDYRDRMTFTHLQPILDYVLSEQEIVWSIPLDKLGLFVNRIKSDLQRRGEIEVTVRKGMFIARKKVA